MLFLGVDIGMQGALAWVDHDGQLVDVFDMPVANGRVSAVGIADLIERQRPTAALFEKVAPFKGHTPQVFAFGRSAGVVDGVLSALRIPIHQVVPAKWQKMFQLPSKARAPDSSRQMALALFPASSDLFKRKKDDGRADAALMALYLRRILL